MSKHIIILSILPFMLGINVNASNQSITVEQRVGNLETEVQNIQNNIATLTKKQKQQSTQLNNIQYNQQQQSLQLNTIKQDQERNFARLNTIENSVSPNQQLVDYPSREEIDVIQPNAAAATQIFVKELSNIPSKEAKLQYIQAHGLESVPGLVDAINNGQEIDKRTIAQLQDNIAQQLLSDPSKREEILNKYGLYINSETPGGNTPEAPYPTPEGTNSNINQDIGPGLPISNENHIAGVTPDPNQVLENMVNKPESNAEQTQGYSDSGQIYPTQSDGSAYIASSDVYTTPNNNTPVNSSEQMNREILNGLDNINNEEALLNAARNSQELQNVINDYKNQNNIQGQLFPDDINNIKQEFANRVINNHNDNDEYHDMTHSQLNLSTSANPDYDRYIRAQILHDNLELANQMTKKEQQDFIDDGIVPEGMQQLKQELDNLQNRYNEQANIEVESQNIIEKLQNAPAEQRRAILEKYQNDGTLPPMTPDQINNCINTGKLPDNNPFYERLQNNIAQQYNMDNNLQYNAPEVGSNIIPVNESGGNNIQNLKYNLTLKNLSRSMNDPNSNKLSSIDISNSIRTNIDQNSSHEELFQKLLATQKALEESNSKLQACEYNCKLLKNQSKGQNVAQDINNISSNIEPNIGIPNTNIQSGNIVVQESNINQVPVSKELTIEQNNTQNIDDENDEFSTLVNTMDNTTTETQGQPVIDKRKNVIPIGDQIDNQIFTPEINQYINDNTGEEHGNENEVGFEEGDYNIFETENIAPNVIGNQQMINQQQVLSGQIETSALQNQQIDNNGNTVPVDVNDADQPVQNQFNSNIVQENFGQEPIIQDTNIDVEHINSNEQVYTKDPNIMQQQVPTISTPNEQNSMQLIPSANQKIVKGQNNLNNKDIIAQEQFINEKEQHKTQQEVIDQNIDQNAEEDYENQNEENYEGDNDEQGDPNNVNESGYEIEDENDDVEEETEEVNDKNQGDEIGYEEKIEPEIAQEQAGDVQDIPQANVEVEHENEDEAQEQEEIEPEQANEEVTEEEVYEEEQGQNAQNIENNELNVNDNEQDKDQEEEVQDENENDMLEEEENNEQEEGEEQNQDNLDVANQYEGNNDEEYVQGLANQDEEEGNENGENIEEQEIQELNEECNNNQDTSQYYYMEDDSENEAEIVPQKYKFPKGDGHNTNFQSGDQNQNIAGLNTSFDNYNNYELGDDIDEDAINNNENFQNTEGTEELFAMNDWGNINYNNNAFNAMKTINKSSNSSGNKIFNSGINKGFHIIKDKINKSSNNINKQLDNVQEAVNSYMNKWKK